MTEVPDYQQILDHLFDGVYFVDRDRVITYWNQGAERISGYAGRQVLGRPCHDGILNHVTATGVSLCQNGCPLHATMNDGHPREAHIFLHHADGHRVPVQVRCAPLRDADGTIVGAVESFSAERGLASDRRELRTLRRQVRIDPLTGIGNRAFLEGRLRALVTEANHHQATDAAIAMIDLDRFKIVNDQYGHETGDAVLRMVANTLKASSRATDAVGRWGGEEFLVLFDDVPNDDALNAACEKLRHLVRWSRLDLENGGSTSVTLSLGATRVRPDDTPETVVARADALMYRSKRAGRDQVTIG
jgi:diguanylate cyclase (GGDEF)-like protein/PAS domain S-box-containing protein